MEAKLRVDVEHSQQGLDRPSIYIYINHIRTGTSYQTKKHNTSRAEERKIRMTSVAQA